MTHTLKGKTKLLNRVRRIKGHVEAIERALFAPDLKEKKPDVNRRRPQADRPSGSPDAAAPRIGPNMATI